MEWISLINFRIFEFDFPVFLEAYQIDYSLSFILAREIVYGIF